MAGGEVIRSQHHRPSCFNCSEVSVLGDIIRLTSSTWWRFHYLKTSSEDVTQNIIYSPWDGTKDPWLCLMAKLLLFCLAWLFSFFLPFLTSLIKFILWNLRKDGEANVFLETKCRQKVWWGRVGGSVPGSPIESWSITNLLEVMGCSKVSAHRETDNFKWLHWKRKKLKSIA